MSSQDCYPEKAPRIDDLLGLLAHHVRREVVHFFENHAESRTATLDDVVAHVERRVPEATAAGLTTGLVHNHLPKLEAAGWLEYDARTDHIRYYGHEHADRWLGELQAVFAE